MKKMIVCLTFAFVLFGLACSAPIEEPGVTGVSVAPAPETTEDLEPASTFGLKAALLTWPFWGGGGWGGPYGGFGGYGGIGPYGGGFGGYGGYY